MDLEKYSNSRPVFYVDEAELIITSLPRAGSMMIRLYVACINRVRPRDPSAGLGVR